MLILLALKLIGSTVLKLTLCLTRKRCVVNVRRILLNIMVMLFLVWCRVLKLMNLKCLSNSRKIRIMFMLNYKLR